MPDAIDNFRQWVQDWYAKNHDANVQSSTNLGNANMEALKKSMDAGATYAKNGPGQTAQALFGGYLDHPGHQLYETGRGLLSLGGDVATHVAGQVNAQLQALSPMDLNKIPGMSGVFPQKPQGFMGHLDLAARNVPVLSDLAQPLNDAADAWQKSMDNLGTDATLGQKIATGAPAALHGAMQVLEPMRQLASGTDQQGKPIDTFGAVKALGASAMLAAPLLHIAGGVTSGEGIMAGLEGTMAPKEYARTRSVGEIGAMDDLMATGKSGTPELNEAVASAKQAIATPGPQAPEQLKLPFEMPQTPEEEATPRLVPDPADDLPDSFKRQFTVEQQLPEPLLAQAHQAIITNPIATKAFVDHFTQARDQSPDAQVTESLYHTFANPEFGRDMITDTIDTRGVDAPTAQKYFLDSYEKTKENFGKMGADYSFMEKLVDHLNYQADWGDFDQSKDAMQMLKDLRTTSEAAAGRSASAYGMTLNLGGWNKAANILQKTEGLRLSAMLTPMRTAAGIAMSQFGLLGTDYMDAISGALVNGLRDPIAKVSGQKVQGSTSAMADLNGLWQATLSRMMNQRPAQALGVPKLGGPGALNIDDVLQSMPAINHDLNQGLAFDTDAHVMGRSLTLLTKSLQRPNLPLGQRIMEGVRGVTDLNDLTSPTKEPYSGKVDATASALQNMNPQWNSTGAYNVARGVTDFMLMPNRWQETQFRKLAFDARYRANIDHIGYSWDDALTELNRRELVQDPETGQFDIKPVSPGLREAIVDAKMHALRQSYAYNPSGGITGAMLKVNSEMSKIIPTSMFGLTFPRAVMNNVLWMTHHSPVPISDLLAPEFRDKYLGLQDRVTPTASRNAQRAIGEATTGLTLFASAMHMANGQSIGGWTTGPKPWQLQHESEKDANGQPLLRDISNLQPFSTYLTIAEHAMSQIMGRPSRVTPQEFFDQMINTRASEIPILGIQNLLTDANSNNPDTQFKVTDLVGNYLAGFAPLFKSIKDYGAAISEVAPELRSVLLHDPKAIDDLQTQVGFARHYSQHALPDNFLAQMRSPATLEKVDPATGRLDVEHEPMANLAHTNRKAITPAEELLNSTPGWSTKDITQVYHDPHATMIFNRAMGTLLNANQISPSMIDKSNNEDVLKDLPESNLQEIFKGLQKLNTPAVSHMMLDKLWPSLRKAAEGLAMNWDAKENGGKPVHFVHELTQGTNLFGSPDVQKAAEDFVRGHFETQK